MVLPSTVAGSGHTSLPQLGLLQLLLLQLQLQLQLQLLLVLLHSLLPGLGLMKKPPCVPGEAS